METLPVQEVRRLALARSGLLKPEWTDFPRGRRASRPDGALEVIRRFGYLQLDSICVAGARSHGIVLHSRLPGLDAELPESLLRPGAALFEYWGHEASWIPIELYPVFAFRRKQFQRHPWWGDLISGNPRLASSILERVRNEGPLRSSHLKGRSSSGWWNLSVAKKVVSALWSAGKLAVCERRNFQRAFDLPERVIPKRWRKDGMTVSRSLEFLLSKALEGHGWATTSTLAATWRLRFLRKEIEGALRELERRGSIRRCTVESGTGTRIAGWIRPVDLELAERLRRVLPDDEEGVLLSPFDPLLWDRARVMLLFGFHQVLEVFTPAPSRRYGYYCMPVLAGERLVARCDLKAFRSAGVVKAISVHYEPGAPKSAKRSTRRALERYASSIGLELANGAT